MKIEYLASGSDDCPLIRLYDFDRTEVQHFREIVRSLVSGDCKTVALDEEEWAESVGGCCLRLRRGDRNQGVQHVGVMNFECVLRSDGWRNVEGLLEPFCDSATAGFQWLTHDGTVHLLISENGQW